MFSSDRIRLAVRVGAFTLAIAPLLVIPADAQHKGGGGAAAFHGGSGGGGAIFRGAGGGGGFGVGRLSIIRPPSISPGPSLHSLSGFRSPSRNVTSHGLTTRHLVTPRMTTSHIVSGHVAGATSATSTRRVIARGTDHGGLVTRSVQGAGRASVLRNNTFASLSTRNPATRTLAGATFQGRLASQKWASNGGWYWRHRPPFIVIGWFGPLFWPFAYWDFIDYTFWPYAYDAFWPFAYDDLYWGLYGPYAYEDPAYANAPLPGRRARRGRQHTTIGEVCSDRVPALTDWPIQQIAQTVQPDQNQQTTLNDLKEATAQALDVLQAACPSDLPSTPTGRLAAMRKRIETMLQAVAIVRPALERFYDLLNDEQKARFNAIAPETRSARRARAGNRPPDLAQVCSGQAAAAVPTQRIERALHPTEAQRSALDELNDATVKAADLLKANCPADETLTPSGRVAAMAQRLNAMLEAIKIVQPALANFYGTLSNEQKARFNELGAGQS